MHLMHKRYPQNSQDFHKLPSIRDVTKIIQYKIGEGGRKEANKWKIRLQNFSSSAVAYYILRASCFKTFSKKFSFLTSNSKENCERTKVISQTMAYVQRVQDLYYDIWGTD